MTRSYIPILVLLLVACGLRAQSAGSASYRLESATFAAAAGRSSSASFTVDGLLSPGGPVGASSSENYLFQGGPLAYLGAGPVPTLLGVRLTPAPDPAVQLQWSGTAANYTLFRAADCATVGASPLTTQTQKSYLDPSAPGETFVCYLVEQAAD